MTSNAPDHPPRFATYAPGRGRGQDWAFHEGPANVKSSIRSCAEQLWNHETHDYGPVTTRVKAVYELEGFDEGDWFHWVKMTPEEFLKLHE